MDEIEADTMVGRIELVPGEFILGEYLVLKCEYCGTGCNVSKIDVPRVIQEGAKDLGLVDEMLFACCPKCLRVVGEISDWGDFLLYVYTSSSVADNIMRVKQCGFYTRVSLDDVRGNITDTQLHVYCQTKKEIAGGM